MTMQRPPACWPQLMWSRHHAQVSALGLMTLAWRDVEAAAPLRDRRVLVLPDGGAPVQDDGGACTCIERTAITWHIRVLAYLHARVMVVTETLKEASVHSQERGVLESPTGDESQGETWADRTPLCAMPNLWVSTLMLVTPGTEKSKGGTRWPSFRANGSTKPPRHASEWHGTPARRATCSNHENPLAWLHNSTYHVRRLRLMCKGHAILFVLSSCP